MAVQWLGLGAFTAMGLGSTLGWGTKIPQAKRKKTYTQMFIAVLFITSQMRKQLRYQSTVEWINNTWYIHAMKYYLAIKRNEALIHQC